MSTALPQVDLTGLTSGQTKTLDFTPFVKVDPMAPLQVKAHLRVFNESGAGLQVKMQQSGRSYYLPAGAWTVIEIERNDSSATVQVIYTLPNPPVSLLISEYYAPGEAVPPGVSLGNSPIGVSGNVNVSTAQSIQNDGNLNQTQFIEATPAGATGSTVSFDNAGNVTIKGNNAGTLTTLIQAIAGASPTLKLVAASVVAEVLGNLQVDGTTSLDNGNITTDGTGNFSKAGFFPSSILNGTLNAGVHLTSITSDGGNLTSDGTGILTAKEVTGPAAANMKVNAVTGQSVSFQVNAVEQARVGAGGFLNETLKFGVVSDADTIDCSAGNDTFYKARGGNINFQPTNGTTQVEIANNGQFLLNQGQTTVNGSVSGTMQYNMAMWGPALKILTVNFTNYNNANVVSINYPTSLSRAFFAVSNIGGMTYTFYNGGVAQSGVEVITALGTSSAAGSSQGLNTTGHGDSIGFLKTLSDQIQFSSSGANIGSCAFIMIGI